MAIVAGLMTAFVWQLINAITWQRTLYPMSFSRAEWVVTLQNVILLWSSSRGFWWLFITAFSAPFGAFDY